MNDGDIKYYSGAGGCSYVSFNQQGTQFSMDIYQSEPCDGDYSLEGSSVFEYSDNLDTLFNTAQEASGITLGFHPPWAMLDDNLLTHGGTKTSSFIASVEGITNVSVTASVTVKSVGTVTVPAGTYLDCRQVNLKLNLLGVGTSGDAFVVAPKVGAIKVAIVKASSTGFTIVGWQSLTSGTVGGVDVRDLANQIPPTLTITSPKSGQRFSNEIATATGKAADNVQVTDVWFEFNGAGWQLAQTSNGWTNWTASLDLTPGTNTFRAYAVDRQSNTSSTNTVRFVYVVSDRLVLQINGNGTVKPDLNGQLLEIGKNQTLTATPAEGYAFCGWTGGVSTNTGKLTFVMQSNLVLQANFIPNPFVAVKGTYQGLFYPAEGRTAQNSGCLTATTTDKGKYTAKLQVGGKTYSFTGQFSCGGNASQSVAPKGLAPLAVVLELDLAGGDAMRGQVSGETWVADLTANRSTFDARTNTAPQTAKYTMVIPGDDASTTAPGGESIGTVKVDAGGKVKLAGTLADGTKITQAAGLSKEGLWPACVSLYRGQGLILGWLTFADRPADDFSGTLDWIKPAQQAAKYYPAGFAIRTEAVGARYLQPTRGSRVINLSAGQVWFANGNLGQSFTNQVTLGTDNKVINLSNNKTILTVTPSTGLFKGSVTDPGTTRSLGINGVVLQKQNAGFGFFLGTNQTGRVFFGQ